MLNVRYLLTEALRSLRLGDIADADVRIEKALQILPEPCPAELLPIPDSAISQAAEIAAAPKCDGNHGGPRCADPECWNDEPSPRKPRTETRGEEFKERCHSLGMNPRVVRDILKGEEKRAPVELVLGGVYRIVGEEQKLIYVGTRLGATTFHQFATSSAPSVVWHECPVEDLDEIEEVPHNEAN